MSLVLKDKAGADVVYTLADRRQNSAIFVHKGTSLLSRSRVTLQLVERANTNRVVGKLEIPTVLECTDQCKTDSVAYTEIGSFDLSSVLAASSADAEEFMAQFASLVSGAAVKAMYTDGVLPQA